MVDIDTELQKQANESFESIELHIIRELSFLGRFLHVNGGSNGSKDRLLSLIFAKGGEIEQKLLIDTTGIKSASLSEALGKLEQEGLITRERSEDDRRTVVVKLTKLGFSSAGDVVKKRIDFVNTCLDSLSSQEKEELLQSLTRLHTSWQSLKEKEETCEN